MSINNNQKEQISYEVGRDDIHLLEYSNVFIGNLVWINRRIHNEIATYDLVVRDIPENWNYYVFYGINRFIDILLHYSFSEEDIEILKQMGLVDSPESEIFYRELKFSGDVLAMKDGTIFFPSEPIVRVTAPISQANMLTALALNAFAYSVRLITKKTRVKTALNGGVFLDSTIVRLPGFEQGMTCLETSYVLGSAIIAPLFFKKFPEIVPTSKLSININHAFIKSFETEREAYRYAIDNYAHKSNLISVMVDTYDLKKGLDIFIEELLKTANLENLELKKVLICIDSGNLEGLSYYVRDVLDKANLKLVGVLVMSNLDEYQIDRMINNKAPINYFIAGTEIVNITDNPKLEVVYKVAQLVHKDGSIEFKAKLTKGKESYPGRKQVFRIYEGGKMIKDIIGLEDENLGEPLLLEYIKNGKLVSKLPTLNEIKNNVEDQLAKLPVEYKNLYKNVTYPVSVSLKLEELTEAVRRKHL